MFIVGITGGVATGKSSVSRVFKDLGCQVVDADEIAREGEAARVHFPVSVEQFSNDCRKKLLDWLKNSAPVFQPMRNKRKSITPSV